MAQVTRLGLYGGARPPYAGFSPAAASVSLSGTVIGANEDDIVTGGKTVLLTLTNDTWVAAGATFDAQRQAIIDGLTSAGVEATGWNAEVRDKDVVTAVVRTSDTVVTITLSPAGGYDITADETITATVPAAALVTSASAVVATPAFDVTFVAAVDDSRRGAGVPYPHKRKKVVRPDFERKDREKEALRRVLEDAYATATGEQRELPAEVVAEVREVVRPFSTSRAQVRLPRPQTIDFAALAEDARAATELMRAIEARQSDDEAAALLLLMAA